MFRELYLPNYHIVFLNFVGSFRSINHFEWLCFEADFRSNLSSILQALIQICFAKQSLFQI